MAQGRGERYATPPSPRSFRKSPPGHTSTGSRFATAACGSCAPCLVVHAPTLAACAPPPTSGDARHGPSRQGLSPGFRLTGWHVLKAGAWAEAGERWALPLPAPLTATHDADSASAVPYFSAGYGWGPKPSEIWRHLYWPSSHDTKVRHWSTTSGPVISSPSHRRVT